MRQRAFLSFVFVFLAFYICPANEIQGKIERVEGRPLGIASHFSFSFSRKGVPAVTYYDLDEKAIKFATVKGGVWKITSISPIDKINENFYCTIIFQKQKPYILYFKKPHTLSLAYNTNKEWIKEDVCKSDNLKPYIDGTTWKGTLFITYCIGDEIYIAQKDQGWTQKSTKEKGISPKIFISESGRISLFYISKSHQLMRSYKVGESWKSSPIPNSKGTLSFSLASKQGKSPTIACLKKNGIYVYDETVPNSGIWKEENVSKEEATCVSISQILGENYIAYIGKQGKELFIAQKKGLSWNKKKVATTLKDFKFEDCFITSDSKGRKVLVFHDGNLLNVLVEYPEGFRLGIIDGRSMVGGYVNTIVTPQGTPFMCYYDYTHRELHFAYREGKKWKIEIVDTLEDVGRYASLGVDPSGNPKISYYDASLGDLKFAWKSNGTWKWDRIDYNGDVGLFTSIKIDKKGIPHISYFNKTTRYIKYATYKKGKGWKRERVAKVGRYGKESVLLLKGNTPIIVFTDGYKKKSPKKGESPVKNYIKIARRISPNHWKIEMIEGPYAADIKDAGLDGDISSDGTIAISYIDREGALQVLYGTFGKWKKEKIDDACWSPTHIKFNSKGEIIVIYKKGKDEGKAKMYISIKKKDWVKSEISLKKIVPDFFSFDIVGEKIFLGVKDKKRDFLYFWGTNLGGTL